MLTHVFALLSPPKGATLSDVFVFFLSVFDSTTFPLCVSTLEPTAISKWPGAAFFRVSNTTALTQSPRP